MRRGDVEEVTRVGHYPSVSVLMPVHRAHPENQQDRVRLKNLVEEARGRLESEVGKRASWPIMERLEGVAEEIDWRANEDGLALFVNEQFADWYRLPFKVDERVAVDRDFETREILYALHRMPRYRVLVVSEGESRLFEGAGDVLDEVRAGGFPVRWRGPKGVTRGPDAPMMQRSNVREAHQDELLSEIDQALVDATRDEPLPLILVGTSRALASFEDVSKNDHNVALKVEGGYGDASASAIGEVVWPPFQEWLRQQRHEVIDDVGAALGANRLAAGIEEAWKGAVAGRGERLVVEEGFRRPAVLDRSGWELELLPPGTVVADRDHLDDAVDELIEMTIEKGGDVVFVDQGSLSEYEGVALILRY